MLDQVNIYTDGSAIGNPGPGGYGIVMEWKVKEYIKEFSEGFRMTTNNRMELLAVIIGLETLRRDGIAVVVYSDSKYVIDAVKKKWVFNWEKKDFKNKKNPDLIILAGFLLKIPIEFTQTFSDQIINIHPAL